MWLLIFFGLGALASIVYGIRKAIGEGDALPVYLPIAAVLSSTVESFVDLLGLCWHPEHGQIVGHRAFGRPIPLHIVFCFIFYFGPVIIYLVYRLKNNAQPFRLMKCFLVAVVLALLFEPIVLYYDGWIYYGTQPFRFLKFPLWWPFINAACVILTGVMIYKALPYLPGWRKIAVIAIMPTAAAASHHRGVSCIRDTEYNLWIFFQLVGVHHRRCNKLFLRLAGEPSTVGRAQKVTHGLYTDFIVPNLSPFYRHRG